MLSCQQTEREIWWYIICLRSGIILGMGSANERRCCNVILYLVGWAHTQNDPWKYDVMEGKGITQNYDQKWGSVRSGQNKHINMIEAWIKWLAFHRQYFEMHFLQNVWWKYFVEVFFYFTVLGHYQNQCCHIINETKHLIEIKKFSLKKMHLKMLSAKWWPFCLSLNVLTHWGLVMPNGNRDMGQHWLRWWLVAWRRQAIT